LFCLLPQFFFAILIVTLYATPRESTIIVNFMYRINLCSLRKSVDYSRLCVPSSALLSFSAYLRSSTSSSSSLSKFSTPGSSTVYLQRGPCNGQCVAPLATCVSFYVSHRCLIVLRYWPPLFCIAALFLGPSFFLVVLLSLVEVGVSDGIFNMSQCPLSFSGLLAS
jgi:hypothetical protein